MNVLKLIRERVETYLIRLILNPCIFMVQDNVFTMIILNYNGLECLISVNAGPTSMQSINSFYYDHLRILKLH